MTVTLIKNRFVCHKHGRSQYSDSKISMICRKENDSVKIAFRVLAFLDIIIALRLVNDLTGENADFVIFPVSKAYSDSQITTSKIMINGF